MSATAGKPYFWKAGALVSIVVAAAGVSLWALGSTPLQGDLVSGGGSMSSGPNKLTGSLGSPFSTTPIQNALGQRIQPGSPTRAAPKGVLGDINGDLSVDFADFILFAQAYNTSVGDAAYNRRADLDGNGTVEFIDFVTFAQNYGG